MRIELRLVHLLASIGRTRGRLLVLSVLCGIAVAGIGATGAYGAVQSTMRVSVDGSGNQANGDSGAPSISLDGRYVVFESIASNLVPGDTNNQMDIFVRDLQEGQTELVSVGVAGEAANEESFRPSMSADGRYVAFASDATNLVPDETNFRTDIFVRDLQEGQTELVSTTQSGRASNGYSDRPSITADGRFVAFESGASNLIDLSALCDDADQNPGGYDIYRRDLQEGRTQLVTPSCQAQPHLREGDSEDPSISADGRYVAFQSNASYLNHGDNTRLHVFVRDLQEGQTERLSVDGSGNEGNDDSLEPSISADGRYVAFESYATNLAPDDTNDRVDIFVRDVQEGQTKRVSVGPYGIEANAAVSPFNFVGSQHPSISADGRYVAFHSLAPNLVPDDTNDVLDVFVRDVLHDTTAPDAPLITSPDGGALFNMRSLTLSGTAEAGAKVELFEGEVSKGEATAGSDGAWSIDLTGVADGSHSYKAKATDEAGNTSVESEARTLLVDTASPAVRKVTPQENATGIAPGANVSALFSEAMRAKSVKSAFKLYKKGSSTVITAKVTYDATAKKAVLDPSDKLQGGTTYRAVVSTGAKDLAGNPLGQQKVWFFMTNL